MAKARRAVIIWDIDGVVANCDHRLHYILQTHPDWKSFHAETMRDKPITHAIIVYKALALAGVDQVFCTARHEVTRDDTRFWLYTYGLTGYQRLMMRRGDQVGSSAQVKKEMLTDLWPDYIPILAFEDNPECVQMYRQHGVPCFAADDSQWRQGTYKEANHDLTRG